jgi:hypothetical protein
VRDPAFVESHVLGGGRGPALRARLAPQLRRRAEARRVGGILHLVAQHDRPAGVDDDACAAYASSLRCPGCGHDRGWRLKGKAWSCEFAGGARQISVTAGTVLHGSKLALHVWFRAATLTATHACGISALQLRKQLGLGSRKSAWRLCAKLRRAMVDPEPNPLSGLVEADETTINHRTKATPVGGGAGRSRQGKLAIAGAVEIVGPGPGRVRLAPIDDYSADSLHGLVAANLGPGATSRPDGWSA